MERFSAHVLCLFLICFGGVFGQIYVTGTITDYVLGMPAESCLVKLWGISPNTMVDSMRTSQAGTYAFSDVPAGVYEVRIIDNRFVADSVQTTITQSAVFDFTVYDKAHVLQDGSIPDTLSKTGSPFLVMNTVTVSKPIAISAGVQVLIFKSGFLRFGDDVSATGQEDDPVVFASGRLATDTGAIGDMRFMSNAGKYVFKYCSFSRLFSMILMECAGSIVHFEHCEFSGMESALHFSAMGRPSNFIFINNRMLHCGRGISSAGYLADTVTITDNLFLCAEDALTLANTNMFVRRNTFFGTVRLDARSVTVKDTITSNIFTTVAFDNAGDKSAFFA